MHSQPSTLNPQPSTAIDRARQLYYKAGKPFPIEDFLQTGVVISLPNTFVMGEAVELEDGRLAWRIEVAVGELRNLLKLFPWHMPFIAFCRWKNRDRQHVYPMAKFLQRTSLVT